MRKLLFLLFLFCISPSLAHANANIQGWCEDGSQNVITSGLTSSTLVQASYPSCTVTVLIHGGGLATIFSNNSGSSLSNPFTASSNGQWLFYAAQGRYDVTISGGGMAGTTTFSDIVLYDPAQQATTLCTVSFTATPTFTANLCSLFQLTLTGNVTSSTISGGVTGQFVTFSIAQTGGPFTFVWPTTFLNPPLLTGIANKNAQFTFVLLSDGFWHHTATGESQVFDTVVNGNQLKINGNVVNAVTGTGSTVALQNSPNFTGNVTFAGRPWIDPTSPTYGAKCDHSTDDSAALQAAGNAAVAAGAILRIPPGVFCNYATGLTFSASILIEGGAEQGSGLSYLWYTGTGNALTINNGTTYIYGVHIRNIQVAGGNNAGTGEGIICSYCNQPTFENVQVGSVANPGFATSYDFNHTAGIICFNCLEANATTAFNLVGASNVNIDACNAYQNTVVFLMGNPNVGIDIHDCTNIEAQDYVIDWDDTNPVSSFTGADHIDFHDNYVIFDGGNTGFPYTNRQALHISNLIANELNISNLNFTNNLIYCPGGPSSCGFAFNIAMANGSSFLTMTAERNWIVGFNGGGVTANSTGATVAWLNNQNLTLTGTPNTDTAGAGQYCVVHYSAGVQTTCPIVTAGTVSTAGGLIDTSLFTQIKRIHWQGTPVTTTNFSVSGWGTSPTLTMGANPVDSSGGITITAGASPSAFPTVTMTFADGTGTNDVYCNASRNDTSSPDVSWRQNGVTPTTSTWTFFGTPITASAYTLIWHCDFH